MTIYYVSTQGSDSGSGSASSPWRTISKAMGADLGAGDEVVVRSGTYRESVVIKKNGAANDHITIRSEVPGGAKIEADGNNFGISIRADYITVDGFDVSGSERSGITGHRVHHVEVTNNVLHDNASNGVFLGQSDFLLVEGNLVYGNAARGPASGIHLKGMYNITGNNSDTGFRAIVRDNVSYDNQREYGPTTDGNGISFDDFQNTQVSSLPLYRFKTLIEGNIVYSNSGDGIQVTWSDYVTVRDNISYHNNAGTPSGLWKNELSNAASSNNTWIGNIAVTDDNGQPAIGNVSYGGEPANRNVSWIDNTTFSGTRGDDSAYASPGNTQPSPGANDLGREPSLSFAEVKALAAKLVSGGGRPGRDNPTDGGDRDDGDNGGRLDSGATVGEIARQSDDWESASDGSSSVIDLGKENGVRHTVGLRFTNMDLDRDATIESAYFVFQSTANKSGNTAFKIEIQNSADARTYSGSSDPDDRSYESASVSWSPGAWTKGDAYRSADVSRLIEAVLDGDGLDGGDALGFRITGWGDRDAAALQTELVINYVLA